MISEIRKACGLTGKDDVLRHTFISQHVAKFRSIGDAALESGNSETILKRHYLNLFTEADAELFWGITPKSIDQHGDTAEVVLRLIAEIEKKKAKGQKEIGIDDLDADELERLYELERQDELERAGRAEMEDTLYRRHERNNWRSD